MRDECIIRGDLVVNDKSLNAIFVVFVYTSFETREIGQTRLGLISLENANHYAPLYQCRFVIVAV